MGPKTTQEVVAAMNAAHKRRQEEAKRIREYDAMMRRRYREWLETREEWTPDDG